jgi:CheY-like chemotaxis protein
MELRAMSINRVAEEALQLCERLLPENITIQLQLESAPWLFRGDGALLQQVLLNLLTNARDAMPQGGVVRLESENVAVDAQFSREHPEVQPGEYVRIGVSDAGVGIDEQTRRHIFEPFFSAKPKGTGLGLAVVYGLVKQLEGTIIVESQPGSGSRFDIYLPRVLASDASAERDAPPVDETRPRLRTMLVEDHPLVRSVLTRMLDQLGHQTIVAEDGQIALRLAAQQSEPLDALITDIGMPNMDGYELAEHMRSRYPDLGIVLVSGYDQYDRLHRAGSRTGLVFLGKPFAAAELDQALAEARAKARARSTRKRPRLFGPAAG